MEGGAFAFLAGGGDDAVVVVYYFLYYREAYAGAFVLVLAMEALEHFEDAVFILLVETYTVVGDGYVAVLLAGCEVFIYCFAAGYCIAANDHVGRHTGPGKLE